MDSRAQDFQPGEHCSSEVLVFFSNRCKLGCERCDGVSERFVFFESFMTESEAYAEPLEFLVRSFNKRCAAIVSREVGVDDGN